MKTRWQHPMRGLCLGLLDPIHSDAMRRLLLLILVFVPLIGACERVEKAKQIAKAVDKALNERVSNTLVWDEKVKLQDGRVIVIKRREVKTGGGFPISGMNPRGITRSYEFCYPPMGLYWKSKGMWHPEILGIVKGKAYVKVPIHGSEECMLQSYPATNAIYFVWEGTAWKKIPYEQFPKEIRRVNLLQNAWGKPPDGDAHGLVTQAWKEKRDQIYWMMAHSKLPLESITDFPNYQGDCARSKSEHVQTDRTAEIFLPPTPDFCPELKQGGNTP